MVEDKKLLQPSWTIILYSSRFSRSRCLLELAAYIKNEVFSLVYYPPSVLVFLQKKYFNVIIFISANFPDSFPCWSESILHVKRFEWSSCCSSCKLQIDLHFQKIVTVGWCKTINQRLIHYFHQIKWPLCCKSMFWLSVHQTYILT